MIWYQACYYWAIGSQDMNHLVGIPPLIFLYFLLISHVFINIHENLNLMCYELDHFGKHVVSMH